MGRGGLVSLVMAVAAIASAEGGKRVTPITEPVVTKECGSCHMAFPAVSPAAFVARVRRCAVRPLRENATLGEAQRKTVLDYLVANAATARGPTVMRDSLPKASRRRRHRSASPRRRGG